MAKPKTDTSVSSANGLVQMDKIMDPIKYKELSDSELTLEVRRLLLTEQLEEASTAICEVFVRAKRTDTLLANEVLVGRLLVSTCRIPQFTNNVIDRLPIERRDSLRVRLMVEYVHKFTLDEIKASLSDCIELILAVPEVVQSILARLVLVGRDDAFFYFIDRFEEFSYSFNLKDLHWMRDQSDYTHGPKQNPAFFPEFNCSFRELILQRGTPRMKEWIFLLEKETRDQ